VWRGWFRAGLGLALLWLAAAPVWADGEKRLPAVAGPQVDIKLFQEELQAAGALKFFETTEELLRLAQFDRALLRYRFLKGQVMGHSLYRPLVTQIDYRLQFLKTQMKLRPADLGPVGRPRKTLRRRVVAAHPPETDKKKEEGKPKTEPKEEPKPRTDKQEEDGAKKQEEPGVTPPPVTPEKPAAAGKGAEGGPAAPPPPETGLPPKVGPADEGEEDQVGEAKPAPPPPSRWERIKRKLQFWKKEES